MCHSMSCHVMLRHVITRDEQNVLLDNVRTYLKNWNPMQQSEAYVCLRGDDGCDARACMCGRVDGEHAKQRIAQHICVDLMTVRGVCSFLAQSLHRPRMSFTIIFTLPAPSLTSATAHAPSHAQVPPDGPGDGTHAAQAARAPHPGQRRDLQDRTPSPGQEEGGPGPRPVTNGNRDGG